MPTHTETPGMFTAPWVTMAQALGWGMDRPSFTVLAGGTETGEAEPFGKTARRVMLDYRQTRPTADGGTEAIVADVTDRPAPAISTQSGSQWLITQSKMMGKGMVERHGDRPGRTPDEPSFTIRADGGGNASGGVVWNADDGEQVQTIRLTTPELAALQGFPDDWTWTGNKTQQARMIGNAAPPALARVVAQVNRPAARKAAA